MIGVFKEQSRWGGGCTRNFGVHLGGGAGKYDHCLEGMRYFKLVSYQNPPPKG